MLITREMDYTLRILRALCREKQLSAAAIAQQEHIPKAVTLKLLRRLRAAGLVESRRGSGGGYLLLRPWGEKNLWDVFRALDEPLYLNRCQRPGYCCENDGGCGLRGELSRVQEVLEAELSRTPLREIFQEKVR